MLGTPPLSSLKCPCVLLLLLLEIHCIVSHNQLVCNFLGASTTRDLLEVISEPRGPLKILPMALLAADLLRCLAFIFWLAGVATNS